MPNQDVAGGHLIAEPHLDGAHPPRRREAEQVRVAHVVRRIADIRGGKTGELALAFGEGRIANRHAEGLARRREQALKVLADLGDAACRIFDVALGIAGLPADGELIVLMGKAQAFEPGNIGFKARLLH